MGKAGLVDEVKEVPPILHFKSLVMGWARIGPVTCNSRPLFRRLLFLRSHSFPLELKHRLSLMRSSGPKPNGPDS